MSHRVNILLLSFVLTAFWFGSYVSADSATQPEDVHFSADIGALLERISQITPRAGADVLLLDDEETIVFDEQGKATRSRYVLYKILTQKGAEEWAAMLRV